MEVTKLYVWFMLKGWKGLHLIVEYIQVLRFIKSHVENSV